MGCCFSVVSPAAVKKPAPPPSLQIDPRSSAQAAGSGSAPAPGKHSTTARFNKFDMVHTAVVEEIERHPEVWVREQKDLARTSHIQNRCLTCRAARGSLRDCYTTPILTPPTRNTPRPPALIESPFHRARTQAAVVARFRALRDTVPAMNLIHGRTIEALARLPRSHERDEFGRHYWRPLEEVYASWVPRPIESGGEGAAPSASRGGGGEEEPEPRAPSRGGPEGKSGGGSEWGGEVYSRMNIAFLSHRWLRSAEGFPDDEGNSKAALVAMMTDYSRNVYRQDTWWWIDWVCANQDDTAGHIAALPLYIAASTELYSAYIPGGDYDSRGWIRCERALSAALNSPRAWKVIPRDHFRARHAEIPETEWWLLEDPAEGHAMLASDRVYLERLSALAVKLWPVAYKANWFAQDNRYEEWGYQPRLEYGTTRIFTWVMNHNVGHLR